MSTYLIYAECGNCGNQNRYEIPKGTEVRCTECADCKCETLYPSILQVYGSGRNILYEDGADE